MFFVNSLGKLSRPILVVVSTIFVIYFLYAFTSSKLAGPVGTTGPQDLNTFPLQLNTQTNMYEMSCILKDIKIETQKITETISAQSFVLCEYPDAKKKNKVLKIPIVMVNNQSTYVYNHGLYEGAQTTSNEEINELTNRSLENAEPGDTLFIALANKSSIYEGAVPGIQFFATLEELNSNTLFEYAKNGEPEKILTNSFLIPMVVKYDQN